MPTPLHLVLGLSVPLMGHSTIQSDGSSPDGNDAPKLETANWLKAPSFSFGVNHNGSELLVDMSYERSSQIAGAESYLMRSSGAALRYRYGFEAAEGVRVGPGVGLSYVNLASRAVLDEVSTESTGWEVGLAAEGSVAWEPTESPLAVLAWVRPLMSYGRAEGTSRGLVSPLAPVEHNSPYAWLRTGWAVGFEVHVKVPAVRSEGPGSEGPNPSAL